MSASDSTPENEDMMDACMLHVLATANGPLPPEAILRRVMDMTEEERKDALARYQEHDPGA